MSDNTADKIPHRLFVASPWSGVPGFAAGRERSTQSRRGTGRAETEQRATPPGHQIVAGDDGLLGAESIKQTDDVADQVKERVLIDFRRAIGLAVAAHVGSPRETPNAHRGRRGLALRPLRAADVTDDRSGRRPQKPTPSINEKCCSSHQSIEHGAKRPKRSLR